MVQDCFLFTPTLVYNHNERFKTILHFNYQDHLSPLSTWQDLSLVRSWWAFKADESLSHFASEVQALANIRPHLSPAQQHNMTSRLLNTRQFSLQMSAIAMAADSDIQFCQGVEPFTYTSIASKHGLQAGSCRPCVTIQVNARLKAHAHTTPGSPIAGAHSHC